MPNTFFSRQYKKISLRTIPHMHCLKGNQAKKETILRYFHSYEMMNQNHVELVTLHMQFIRTLYHLIIRK